MTIFLRSFVRTSNYSLLKNFRLSCSNGPGLVRSNTVIVENSLLNNISLIIYRSNSVYFATKTLTSHQWPTKTTTSSFRNQNIFYLHQRKQQQTLSRTFRKESIQLSSRSCHENEWQQIKCVSLNETAKRRFSWTKINDDSSSSSSSISHLPSAKASSSETISQNLVRRLPASFRPFAQLMRLDKPIGTMLLLWPCLWSIALATSPGHLPPLGTIALFSSGALLMRSSGCIINDIWDRRFDRKVERTKSRPLASKQLSIVDSIVLLQASLGFSLLILLQFDLNSIILGASSLGLVVTYPAFKRFTHWPQLILGATFNWGALLGWSVVRDGSLDLTAVLPLYVAGIFWTLFYDTIYAHQDRKDDIRIGLKSTAIKFANSTNQYLYGFSGLMTGSLLVGGLITEQLWPYYLAVSLTGANLARITYGLNIDDPQSCSKAFNQNNQIGWILFFGIVLSTWMKSNTDNKKNKNLEPEKPEIL